MDDSRPDSELGKVGVAVIIVLAVAALALLIWMIVEVWPLLVLAIGLGLVSMTSATNRDAYRGAAFSCVILMVVVLVVKAFLPSDPDASATASSSASSATSAHPQTAAAPTAGAEPPAPVEPAGETVSVVRAIDGATFELTDGRQIRVLGIDSCKLTTQGGRDAKESADSSVKNPYNQPITVTRQPGVDRDSSGRLLRYVQLHGYDYGTSAIARDDIAAYEGNAVDPAYLALLRSSDGPLNCAGVAAATPDDTGTDVYVNPPDVDHHDHHKSRFCRRHWYC